MRLIDADAIVFTHAIARSIDDEHNWNELCVTKDEIDDMPSAEPDRKFLEIIIEYPKICTYPEYKGKPYYSIKYEENGEIIVGFGTYKPEVLSQYLREYFISSAESEREKGEWVYDGIRGRFPACKCSICGHYENADWALLQGANYCPNCGADMRGDK